LAPNLTPRRAQLATKNGAELNNCGCQPPPAARTLDLPAAAANTPLCWRVSATRQA